MRYALLIYSNEKDVARMSEQEQATYMEAYNTFTREVHAQGLLNGGEPLQSIATATTVRIRDGKTLVTDGPFAETKEQLGGFYLLNCKDLDQAIEIASKVPDATFGSIEIRPILEVQM
ncbi:MAG TPA: YciI family protein [Ktedonobacteraceae bacterium]|nr:YciI family protein [Ktedonobacteraceae bacterium]